jgi:hypothetical protein
MRFALVILAVAAVLAACTASARWLDPGEVPMEWKTNPPPGSHWDEEKGVFALDVPLPIQPPLSMSLTVDANEISFDDNMLWFFAPQQGDYFALTKFPTPDCSGEKWILTAVWLGVYNATENIDPGAVFVYDHEPDDYIGAVLGFADFMPDPYPELEVEPHWQQVDFYPWIEITEPEFWVAWDYTPGYWPDDGSAYGIGYPMEGLPPDDWLRFFESPPYPGPSPISYGDVWLIRAFGHCEPGPPVDIKPQSCPNPLGVKDRGVIPMAILGNDMLDVSDIDPTSVRLEGELLPLRWAYEDVAEPFPGELCDCWTNGADGYADLTLKFDAPELVEYLGDIEDGDELELILSWTLYDGTAMSGSDCMIVRAKGKGPQSYADRLESNRFALFQNSPNPFKSGTSISFSLTEKSHTTLTVHDLSGRLVSVVADGEFAAGAHTVTWNANVPSGIYFYRIKAGEFSAGRRMVVLR